MRHTQSPGQIHPVIALRARQMRSALTPSEQKLWDAIRGCRLGVWFRRQVPLGRYIDLCGRPRLLARETHPARVRGCGQLWLLDVRKPKRIERPLKDAGSLRRHTRSGARHLHGLGDAPRVAFGAAPGNDDV
jgi:hypothetical protein